MAVGTQLLLRQSRTTIFHGVLRLCGAKRQKGMVISMFKKAMALLLAGLMVFALSGCGIREKISEKIGEAVTEGIVNQFASGADIDIDGEEIVIKGEDGEEVTFGSTEWPQGEAIDLLPAFNQGSISSVMNSEKYCMIIVSDVSESDFNNYVQAVQDAGFSENPFTMDSEEGLYFGASYNETTSAAVTFSGDSGEMTIVASISE